MQVTNNYQPSFKAGLITKRASEVMAEIMPLEELTALQDKFIKTFKDSNINVRIDKASRNKQRLDAMMSFNHGKFNPDFDEFFIYIEERLLSSIFRSPEKFINRIIKVYNKKAVPFIENGYKEVK